MTANWTRLNPKNAPAPITPYFSQGAKAPLGQIVFVSGQVALDANGKLVGKDDVIAQFEQAMRNVIAVLAEAGATLEHVVKQSVYLVRPEHFGLVVDVRTRYFGKTRPASSTFIISGLARAEFLVEVEVEAVIPG